MVNRLDASWSGDLSRQIAAAFGERRGRSISAIVSDWVAAIIEFIFAHRPSREAVMDWVHLAMAAAAFYLGARLFGATTRA